MRKLNEFKKDDSNLLSENELLKINGGLLADGSRYTCWTDTCDSGCSDRRCVQTIDENGESKTTTTTTTTNNDCGN